MMDGVIGTFTLSAFFIDDLPLATLFGRRVVNLFNRCSFGMGSGYRECAKVRISHTDTVLSYGVEATSGRN